MPTYTKVKLSATPAGNIPKTISGVTFSESVHSTGTSATVQDEVWLYITNNTAFGAGADVEFDSGGGANASTIFVNVPAQSTILALAGLPITGDGTNSTIITISNSYPDPIRVYGYVNRITP